MPRLLSLVMLVGIGLLVVPVIYLAVNNRSVRVVQPALVILGSAVVTLAVTLAVTLRSSKWDEILYASVIVDSDNLPAEVSLASPNMPVALRLSDYRNVASKALEGNADRAHDHSESSLLFQRIIQLEILEHMSGRYADGWARTFSFPKALGGFQIGSFSREISTTVSSRIVDARALRQQIEAANPVAAAIHGDSSVFGDGLALPIGTDLIVNALSKRAVFEPQPLFWS